MSAVGESGSPVLVPKLREEAAWNPPAKLVERLYARAQGAKWQLDPSVFAEALQRSAEHFSRARSQAPLAGPGELESYLGSLHLEDLALACACAEGSEAAWEHFVREFRPVLYAAARAIAGESAARDLADSLYGELFGVSRAAEPREAKRSRAAEPRETKRSGIGAERKSLFRYFHGRSKLSTWLRAVLAQRHVDALRTSRRTESLEDSGVDQDRETRPRTVQSEAAPPDPERERYLALLQATLTQALAALEPRDRLRLSCYYVQDLTLAQIGRLLGEHEATVSRKLDRTRRELRKKVEFALVGHPHRLSQAQLQLCFEYAREEWPFDLTGVLSRGSEGSGDPAGGGEIK